ncbi:type II toxin-antitoxin system Phd/YefM family antitoxin [Enterovirga sp. GCM10030262]|uniref:type II toxin-antitoxin system Phd/YefM family antitoxin n=1 Tax=Enterovirga sp. GCM10030262 TaxID=3273391 RepID=UPI003618BA9B
MAEADPRKMINVHDAKTHFSRLLERAHAGEEIILAKAGKPYAKLVPIENVVRQPKRKPGGLKVSGPIPDAVWFDPLPDEELALWEGKRLEKYGY